MDAEHDGALLCSAGAGTGADAGVDTGAEGGFPGVEAEERAHLDEVLGAVRAAVDRARGLAERTEASHREAGAHLAASRGELAPEEAHLSAYELNRMDAQAALAHRSQSRLEKLLDSPYFARVDFVEGEEGAPSSAGSVEGETAAACQNHLPRALRLHLGESGARFRLAKPGRRAVLRLRAGAGRLRGAGWAPHGNARAQASDLRRGRAPALCGGFQLQRAR